MQMDVISFGCGIWKSHFRTTVGHRFGRCAAYVRQLFCGQIFTTYFLEV